MARNPHAQLRVPVRTFPCNGIARFFDSRSLLVAVASVTIKSTLRHRWGGWLTGYGVGSRAGMSAGVEDNCGTTVRRGRRGRRWRRGRRGRRGRWNDDEEVGREARNDRKVRPKRKEIWKHEC
eukprot:759129-Hanusia_phi.AAC.4